MSGIFYLEFHDAAKNSHKFYAGNPQTGYVLYGRIGATGTLKIATRGVHTMKYEKQNKGYKSAPMPQYVEDTLTIKNDAPVKKPRSWSKQDELKWEQQKNRKAKLVKDSANRGLLNWFGSLSRTE